MWASFEVPYNTCDRSIFGSRPILAKVDHVADVTDSMIPVPTIWLVLFASHAGDSLISILGTRLDKMETVSA